MIDQQPRDPHAQRADLADAIELLGGVRAAAAALDISERNLRYVLDGERNVGLGHLRGISVALSAHVEFARALERRLNPLFTANLTEHQRRKREKADG